MSGYNLKRIAGIYHKYGWRLPFYGFRYKAVSGRFLHYAKMLKKLESDCFVLRQTDDRRLYFGDSASDSERILRGERSILFYQDKAVRKWDKKYRWEENRMHQLYPLALEAAKGDHAECIEYLKEQLSAFAKGDFLTDTCAMEVAIALINVTVSVQLTGRQELLKGADVKRILSSGLIYILENQEKGLVFSNNHYFFDLLGILWVLRELEYHPLFEDIMEFADQQMQHLLRQMISGDGSLYEGSTHYHKYVMESLLEFLVFTGDAEREKYGSVAAAMISFLEHASDENRLFGIGDNDSGRVLPFPSYFQYASGEISTIRLLAERLQIRPSKEKRILCEDFGIAVVHKRDYAVALRCDMLKAVRQNRLIGGHSHNDQLSVQLRVWGEELFIDHGTYLYIFQDNCRMENRTTAVHNTLSIDGLEQNPISNDWRYEERTAKGSWLRADSGCLEAVVSYQGITHTRRIRLKADSLVIEDRCTGGKKGMLRLLLAPEVKVHQTDSRHLVLTLQSGSLTLEADAPVCLAEAYCAREYGRREQTTCIQLPFTGKGSRISICLPDRNKEDGGLVKGN